MGVSWRPLIMFMRGVLVTLPAQLPKMPQLNPKGLSGSIKTVERTAGSGFRESLSVLTSAVIRAAAHLGRSASTVIRAHVDCPILYEEQ